ncbi:hypothetical protein BC628DRAFT_1420110 [Trametes gibbosa]|nr:hypothetical protein BC628DRAFT_1420110 [Trametes gibbosa]
MPDITFTSDPKTCAQRLVERARICGGVQALCALVNAEEPINRLPVELLVEIFSYLQAGCYQRNVACHRVCRHWSVVGATTPELWHNLAVGTRTNLLRTGLARSKDMEVTIAVGERANKHITAQSLALIGPHVHRVRALHLPLDPTYRDPELTTFLSTTPMRALRSLSADGTQILLSAPLLQVLQFSNINAFIPTPSFSQLRKLVYDRNLKGHLPSTALDTMVDILHSLENIEELSLTDTTTPMMSTRPIPPVTATKTLRRLRKIRLRLAAVAVERLLHEIVIPPIAEVDIVGHYGPRPPVKCLGELIPPNRVCLPILTRLVIARVCVTQWEHHVTGYVSFQDDHDFEEGRIYLRVPGKAYLGAKLNTCRHLHDVSDPLLVVCHSPLEVLHIRCTPGPIEDIDWRDVFMRFGTLRELNIVSEERIRDRKWPMRGELLFDALNPGLDAARRAACPALRRLSITRRIPSRTMNSIPLCIVSCLEARREALGTQLALDELTLCFQVWSSHKNTLLAQKFFEKALGPLVGSLSLSWELGS